MAPTTSRDFQRVARQRPTTADVLLRERLNLDAQYIGGYAVEYSLKALILEHTLAPDATETLQRLTAGAKMHRPEVLPDKLRDRGISLPPEIARRMRRFDWTTDLRYATGRRDTCETRGVEEVLRRAGFQTVDADRYNSASIRVRVIDDRFEGLSLEQRDALVEVHLVQLPERTQADIMNLYTFAPSERQPSSSKLRERLLNAEFDAPSPSVL